MEEKEPGMKEDFLVICKNKVYWWMLSLTAVCCYGFLITHQTVGIDDTPYAYYFEEGLNAIVGRWFLFLLNKVFRVSDFTPFLTDFAGVLIFMVGVTVWCVLLHSVCKEQVSMWGYVFFSCIFLSCPLIAEVYTYYLHNGISIGYLCTGISLCFFKELAGQAASWSGKQRGDCEGDYGRGAFHGSRAFWGRVLAAGAGTAVFLVVALGCYESFMIVWLVGVCLVLLTESYMGIRVRVFLSLLWGAAAAVLAIVLRSVVIAVIIRVFGLGDMRDEAVLRSITEMLGWIFEPGAFAEFAMAVKRFYVMYGVFAYAYYPIKIFVFSAAFLILFGGYRSIRQKNGWIVVLTLGSLAMPFLLVVIEGKATLYRAAQFLPVVCGYGAFLAAYSAEQWKNRRRKPGTGRQEGESAEEAGNLALEPETGAKVSEAGNLEEQKPSGEKSGGCQEKRRIWQGLVVFVLCAVLWKQCFEMNKWFYVDWMKYEAAVRVAGQIAYELERHYDTSKPIVFTGTCQPPKGIIADAYVGYGTETFYKMKRLTDLVDEHLLEKFYREYGVWVAQTPALSVLDWGVNAFGTDEELVRFFSMHGYELIANTDAERFESALQLSMEWPRFPAEGSIADMGDYIIVHF